MSTTTSPATDPVPSVSPQGRPSLPEGLPPSGVQGGPAAAPAKRRALRPKSASALGMTAGEVAALLGIGATAFWELRRTCPDFPKGVSPLWPGGRKLWDRDMVLRWWKRRARQAQQEQAK